MEPKVTPLEIDDKDVTRKCKALECQPLDPSQSRQASPHAAPDDGAALGF